MIHKTWQYIKYTLSSYQDSYVGYGGNSGKSIHNDYEYTHIQYIQKVSTPFSFLQIFNYIFSWENSGEMKL